jgi:hypothetical protein
MDINDLVSKLPLTLKREQEIMHIEPEVTANA